MKKFRIRNTAVALTAEWMDHVRCTAGAAGFTITLPSAVGRTGDEILVEKIDLAVGVVTVAGAGAETIEGAANVGLAGQFQKVRLISNGVSWDLAFDGRRVPCQFPDPGAANPAWPVVSSIYCGVTRANGAAETGTVGLPTFAGQRLLINSDVDGGGANARTLTFSAAFNDGGNTTVAFDAVQEAAEFVGVQVAGAFRWQSAWVDGATLA